MYHKISSSLQKFGDSSLRENRFNGECGNRHHMPYLAMDGGICFVCSKPTGVVNGMRKPYGMNNRPNISHNVAAIPSQNTTNLFTSSAMNGLYDIPTMHDSSVNYNNDCPLHGANPFIYHNAIQPNFHTNYQEATETLTRQELADKNESNTSSMEALKKQDKGQILRKCVSAGKWKKAFKVIKKKKVARSSGTMKALKTNCAKDDLITNGSVVGGGGDASRGLNKTEANGLRQENMEKSTPEGNLAELMEKTDLIPKTNVETSVETQSIGNADSENNHQESCSETKQIYRANIEKGYSRMSTCSSRTFATDNEEHKKRCNDKHDKLRVLKEAMPSIVAKSKSDHLTQLKQCIESYVDYMILKSDLENGSGALSISKSNSSTVKVDSSKLIDIVSNPMPSLSSDVTQTVAQSLTDALISADEEDRETQIPKGLKKMRDKQFEKVKKEVDSLFAMIKWFERLYQA